MSRLTSYPGLLLTYQAFCLLSTVQLHCLFVKPTLPTLQSYCLLPRPTAYPSNHYLLPRPSAFSSGILPLFPRRICLLSTPRSTVYPPFPGLPSSLTPTLIPSQHNIPQSHLIHPPAATPPSPAPTETISIPQPPTPTPPPNTHKCTLPYILASKNVVVMGGGGRGC
jgi:hypothetical protein